MDKLLFLSSVIVLPICLIKIIYDWKTQESSKVDQNGKGVIIKYIKNDNLKYLIIQDDDPNELLKEINKNPHAYLDQYISQSFKVDIISIYIFNSDKNKNMNLMLKIANHLKLDTKNIKTYEELCNYIDNHIKYSPPPLIEEGYYKIKEEFESKLDD